MFSDDNDAVGMDQRQPPPLATHFVPHFNKPPLQPYAAETETETEHSTPDISHANMPNDVADAIEKLGLAIAELGKHASNSSISSEVPQASTTEALPPVSTTRANFVMRQMVASILHVSAKPQPLFRIRDETRRKRYKVLHPGKMAGGPDMLVVDATGRPVWSVRPSKTAAAKILFKPGSNYHIALVRRHWVAYLNKLVEGVAFRHGQERVVFNVKGDALGRRFQIYAGKELIAQAHRRTQIAQPGKDFELTAANFSTLDAMTATWSLSVEPGVDSALMTAVMAVLERWTVEAKVAARSEAANNEERRRSSDDGGSSSRGSTTRG